eukprot:6192882-Pleurochrysis_carterae.AAC.1
MLPAARQCVHFARVSHAPVRSCPFFLYADADAVLDSRCMPDARVRAVLGDARTPRPHAHPASIPASHIARNAANCRNTWQWKQSSYYADLKMSRD